LNGKALPLSTLIGMLCGSYIHWPVLPERGWPWRFDLLQFVRPNLRWRFMQIQFLSWVHDRSTNFARNIAPVRKTISVARPGSNIKMGVQVGVWKVF
jgi:hypothetical protein